MKITIEDIARKAGVSKSTVSYALNGKRPISEHVRNRIAAVIGEFDYHPSYAAQMLTSRKTMGIGIATDQCSNPGTASFLEEMGRLSRQSGYHLMLGISGGVVEEGREILKQFASGIVDGIINCLPEISVVEAVGLCGSVPLITYNRHAPSSPAEPDYIAGITELLSYLFTLGHRKIGFIASRQRGMQSPDGDPCQIGYRMFCEKYKIDYNPELVFVGNGDFDSGSAFGELLYKRGATAIFAGNDRAAAGVLSWANENGVSVPGQLSVAGWDDSPLASACSPSLTTVQMPYSELAQYTFNALLKKIKGGGDSDKHIINPHLMIRRSTAQLQK